MNPAVSKATVLAAMVRAFVGEAPAVDYRRKVCPEGVGIAALDITRSAATPLDQSMLIFGS